MCGSVKNAFNSWSVKTESLHFALFCTTYWKSSALTVPGPKALARDVTVSFKKDIKELQRTKSQLFITIRIGVVSKCHSSHKIPPENIDGTW